MLVGLTTKGGYHLGCKSVSLLIKCHLCIEAVPRPCRSDEGVTCPSYALWFSSLQDECFGEDVAPQPSNSVIIALGKQTKQN